MLTSKAIVREEPLSAAEEQKGFFLAFSLLKKLSKPTANYAKEKMALLVIKQTKETYR